MTKGCPKCGRIVDQRVDVCPFCHYQFAEIEKVYKLVENENKEKVNEYAGFIRRMVAFHFDGLIMTLVFIGIIYGLNINLTDIRNLIFPFILTTGIYFFYCTILEATPLKGTLGSKILNIIVVDDGGYQISFGMSLKRNLAKILNILTLGLGYIILIFNKRKQTLADIVSDTYVKNSSLEYNLNLYYANTLLRLLAFIIDILIIWLIYFVLNLIITYLINNNLITNSDKLGLIITVFMIIIGVIYFIFMDSKNGTFGKQLFAFKVTNLNGQRISYVRNFARIVMLLFEMLFIPFGFLLCFTHPRRQTFKDLVTHSVVIKTVYYK